MTKKKTWLHGEDKPSCIILTALPAAAAAVAAADEAARRQPGWLPGEEGSGAAEPVPNEKITRAC